MTNREIYTLAMHELMNRKAKEESRLPSKIAENLIKKYTEQIDELDRLYWKEEA